MPFYETGGENTVRIDRIILLRELQRIDRLSRLLMPAGFIKIRGLLEFSLTFNKFGEIMALVERKPPKRVMVYGDPKDFETQKVEKFIRNNKFNAIVHDITSSPLDYHQLTKLLKHFDLSNFFKPDSELSKHKAENISLERRRELLQILANDNNLLQFPIVDTGRLMSAGANLQTLSLMLEIKEEQDLESEQASSAA